MKPGILVTRRLPEAAMQALEASFRVECNPHDRPLSREELLAGAAGMDGLLPLLTDRIDEPVLAAAGGRLRVVANYAVGYNNIDVAACTRRGIAVANTPEVLTDTTADLAMALILAVARRLVPADAYARAGRFQGWEPRLLLGADVHHKTLGLVGFGRIGRAVARRAAGFGMRVLYTGRGRSGAGGRPEPGARRVELEELLAESDFVSLHVPLTPRTRHLINAGSLARMKPGAYLINTSRGEVVDENALAAALGEGRLAGAGLDVFEREPEIHPDLLGLENVVLAPHIGSASLETRTAMGRLAADNLRAVLVEGSRPPACVNPEIYD